MKFKKKKKNQMGYFYSMSPGNPKYNAEMFNHLMGSGDMPEAPSGSGGEACGESLTEDQQKNTYEIVYLNRYDEKGYAYIDAYSEKQAVIILKKQRKGIYRILSIDCIEDHSKDDGEQIGLFEDKDFKPFINKWSNIKLHNGATQHHLVYKDSDNNPLHLDIIANSIFIDAYKLGESDNALNSNVAHQLLHLCKRQGTKDFNKILNKVKFYAYDGEGKVKPLSLDQAIELTLIAEPYESDLKDI